MYLRTRTKALFGISLLVYFANNVNQVRSSVLNSEDRNGFILSGDGKPFPTRKVPPSTSQRLSNCTKFQLSPVQPAFDKHAQINKCCPSGEIYEKTTKDGYRCVPGKASVNVESIFAVFYGDLECIDKENELHFDYIPKDSCFRNNFTFQYGKEQNDQLFVIQNGSLLVVTEDKSMAVFNLYCVEVDSRGYLLAKVCDELDPIVLRATVPLISAGLLIASTALLTTCWAYAVEPRLNDFLGYLVVGHVGTFLVGMILIVLGICGNCKEGVVSILAHVFLMSSNLAFLLMNIHNKVYVDYYHDGLEINSVDKRNRYVLSTVLFAIAIIPLLQPWRNSLIFYIMLCIYHVALAVVLLLTQHTLTRISNGIELTGRVALSTQSRINGERLKDIKSLNRLCQLEATFSLFSWIRFGSLQQHLDNDGRNDFYRLVAAYVIIFQGTFIGLIFLTRHNKKIVNRSIGADADTVEMSALRNQLSS